MLYLYYKPTASRHDGYCETTPPAVLYPALIDAAGPDIPASLVYEILNGKPLYYWGYRAMLEYI